MTWRALVLLVGACGEEGDGAAGQAAVADPESSDAAEAADEPTEPDSTAPEDAPEEGGTADGGLDDEVEELLDDLDFGDGGARIVLGDRTYEFTLSGNSPEVDGTTYLGVCQTLFGAIAGAGYEIQDDQAATIEFDLPPEDWESYEDGRFDTVTPRIKIENVATEETWVADLMLADGFPEVAGSSQIDEWVTDGRTASGTATFTAIHPYGSPVEGAEPSQGSFELGCADD